MNVFSKDEVRQRRLSLLRKEADDLFRHLGELGFWRDEVLGSQGLFYAVLPAAGHPAQGRALARQWQATWDKIEQFDQPRERKLSCSICRLRNKFYLFTKATLRLGDNSSEVADICCWCNDALGVLQAAAREPIFRAPQASWTWAGRIRGGAKVN